MARLRRLRRKLLGSAHVDELEVPLARCRERGHAHLDIRLFALQLPDECAARCRHSPGGAAALSFVAVKLVKSRSNSSPSSWPESFNRILSVKQRLQRAESSGDRTEHAGFGAVADDSVRRRLGPQAPQAGMARRRPVDLQLPFVLVDAREDRGPLRQHRGIVDQELGAEIVAAIDHEVVLADQGEGIVRGEAGRVRLNMHLGIEPSHGGFRQRGLRLAHIRQGVQRLSVQVARIELVGIDRSQEADAGTREVLQHRASEAAGADDQHAAAASVAWPAAPTSFSSFCRE